ncbi:unnamed protein product [Rhizophagus irregularis]|nr:unnamed protein product [Rhizophagus irregularis]
MPLEHLFEKNLSWNCHHNSGYKNVSDFEVQARLERKLVEFEFDYLGTCSIDPYYEFSNDTKELKLRPNKQDDRSFANTSVSASKKLCPSTSSAEDSPAFDLLRLISLAFELYF